MTLEELERTVAHLPPEQLARFRAWFLEFDARNWDTEIERDAGSGKLDSIAEEAIQEHRAGRSHRL